MSRKIRFRAWSAKAKEMVDHWHVINDPDEWFEALLSGDANEGDVLMQYTGLEDKNGIPIYEGDILKNNNKYNYPIGYKGEKVQSLPCAVEWIKDGWWKVFSLSHGRKQATRGLDDLDLANLEVIGSVFENPELLKENV